jgi:hypothetical protein
VSKFAKGKSWIEQRLADSILFDGQEYRIELVARKGTGTQGFRVTVVFMPLDGGADAELDLPNAATTADVHQLVRELSGDAARLEEMFRGAARK